MSAWHVGEYWNKDGTGHALAVWPCLPDHNAAPGETHDAICLVSPWDDASQEDREHARLIAAAPDLLSALREINSEADNGIGGELHKIQIIARAAIAKAERKT